MMSVFPAEVDIRGLGWNFCFVPHEQTWRTGEAAKRKPPEGGFSERRCWMASNRIR